MTKQKIALVLAAIGTPLLSYSDAEMKKKVTPYTLENNAFIVASGKVKNASDNGFMLDYGKGEIMVEMDDYDWYSEGYNLLNGDKVRITGKIDHDKGETRSIEAGSVYVEQIDTYLMANAADEEDYTKFQFINPVVDGTTVEKRGYVSNISGEEFDVTLNGKTTRVDIEKMKNNPLDNEGIVKLKEGDFVSVIGDYDIDLFEQNEIDAVTVTKFD